MAPKVALITVSLAGERTELAKKFATQSIGSLSKYGLEIIGNGQIYLTGQEVLRAVNNAIDKEVDCIVYLIGTWIYAPNIVTHIMNTNIPAIIWGIPEPASFSTVGANVVHGSLDEIGIYHHFVYGMPGEKDVLEKIAVIARASMVKNKLRKAIFGLIGGRSIGMYTSNTDPIQVKRIFGLEIEHVDQFLMIEYAKKVNSEDVNKLLKEINNIYGEIQVPEEVIKKSIRVYCALKKLVREHEYDFIGVKCLEEVINHYVSCCLAVALLNDEEIVTACQSDINAAISMYILNLLTQQSVVFADVSMLDKKNKIVRLVNCGSMATSLSKNKKEVDWGYQYEYMGKERGACPIFCCKNGPVTFGSLNRINGDYVMQITTGTAIYQSKSVLKQVRDIWPQAFIKIHCDADEFIQSIRSNHIVVGYGEVKNELDTFCNLIGIKAINIE
jgi:L-fucose isomerase